MSIEGVDFSWARPSPQGLLNAGKRFVYRYIGVNVGGKSATRAELDEYTSAGLDVILGYEEDGQELLGGYDAGVRIGHAIQSALNDLGYPGAVVYANADFDATEAQQVPINAALDGIASVIGLARLGLYGGYWVIKRAFDAGKITYAMQTYAWSGGNWDPRAQVQQYSNGEQVNGSDVDFDRATQAQFGQIGAAALAGLPGTPFEGEDMPLNADTDYPAFSAMLQRALAYDVRQTGLGATQQYGPTLWERLNLIQATAGGGKIDPKDLAASVVTAIPVDLAQQVIDGLAARLKSGGTA